jgi:signal peptidase I
VEVTRESAADAKTTHRSFWRELPVLVIVAVLVAVLVRTFVVQTFWIPSGSMEQTLRVDDRVLVNKLVYDFRDPRRGEIVVFVAPDSWRTNPNEKDFIKRVIGTPGDHVVCCDSQGRVTVNGRSLDEPYVYPGNAHGTPFDVVVPKGRLFVMGDHREISGDSTKHLEDNSGTIPESSVVGRAFLIFWPVDRIRILSVPPTFENVPAPSGG